MSEEDKPEFIKKIGYNLECPYAYTEDAVGIKTYGDLDKDKKFTPFNPLSNLSFRFFKGRY